MTKSQMTPDEEHGFYSRPENQEPQGSARRRSARLTAPIPVWFPPELLEEIQRRAAEDGRSVSSWIRRAVEHEPSAPLETFATGKFSPGPSFSVTGLHASGCHFVNATGAPDSGYPSSI